MSRRLEWLPEAVRDLLEIPSTADAAEVDRTLQSFAATGQGFLRRLPREEGPDSTWLYTKTKYVAAVQLGPGIVLVLRVHTRT